MIDVISVEDLEEYVLADTPADGWVIDDTNGDGASVRIVFWASKRGQAREVAALVMPRGEATLLIEAHAQARARARKRRADALARAPSHLVTQTRQ